MKFEKKEKTPHQEVRKQRFIKALLLKKQVVKLKNDSYKCITCDKVVHNIIFHWNTYHKCIKCNKMKNTFKEHQCKNHKLKTFYKQFKDAKNASPQKEVPNNESKSSRDKTVSTQMLETKIIPVFASSQNEVYNISDSSENVCQQNEFNNNSPNNESKPSSDKTVSTQMLETKINPVFASSEYTKSDDPIEETDEWSDFIKDLKKNNKHSKLFEGMPDSPEKQSESISSSDEILSEEILSNKYNESDEKNIQYIPVESKSQSNEEIDQSNKDDILEDQVVDDVIINESNLSSNNENLSEERSSNKVHDESNVKIIEDSDFPTLKIKMSKIINHPLELDSNTKLDYDVNEPGPSNVKNDSANVSNNEYGLLSGKAMLHDIKSNKHKVLVMEESEKTANTAGKQKGQNDKTRKGKKLKKDNMKIIQDVSESSVILKCHKSGCSKECDTPFEAYRHQNRKHKVKFAKDMKSYLNFSMRKTMAKKVDDKTGNVGLYIEIINKYHGENKDIILKRKKLENWVQLGVYDFKDQKVFSYLYFLNDKNLKKITLKVKTEKKVEKNES